jgi:tRNA pseudouridine55 synthase
MSDEGQDSRCLPLDGVLVVDKPAGPSSHDVVATTRRVLGAARIGHTGTLDPLASGVLPLVVGRATRLSQHLTGVEKEYEAAIRFGVETDSYDSEGQVLKETGRAPSREALDAAVARFRGSFAQTPPGFSAKKVAGHRAYDLARRSAPVELRPVPVVAYAIEVLEFAPPAARLRVVCSAGFYVRSLAHDLGRTVGTGAILSGLIRTRAGRFLLRDATPFDAVARGDATELRRRLIPLDDLLPEVPAVSLTSTGARRALHGHDVGPADIVGGPIPEAASPVRLMTLDGRMLGLAEPSKTPGFLHPAVVFS